MWQLFLDDERMPSDYLINCVICRNFDDAVITVKNFLKLPNHIHFDHDLGENSKTGYDFAKWFMEYIHNYDIVHLLPEDFSYSIHSQNPVGAKNIDEYMKWSLTKIKEIKNDNI